MTDTARKSSSTQTARAADVCKLLSKLCTIAFAIISLWILAVLAIILFTLAQSPNIGASFPQAIMVIVFYALYGGNSCMIPLILGRMLRDISTDETPFTIKNANRLRFLSLVLFIYAVLEALLAYADSQLMFSIQNGAVEVGGLVRDFASNAATTLDLFPLVIAAVFFALSYVFKYGVLLQQESDETL